MYSPLTLAYIGDAAYEIVIRMILVRAMQVNTYRHAAGFKGGETAMTLKFLEPLLPKRKKQIYKRGRKCETVY